MYVFRVLVVTTSLYLNTPFKEGAPSQANSLFVSQIYSYVLTENDLSTDCSPRYSACHLGDVAGTAMCNHTVALLFQTDGMRGMVGPLPDLSVLRVTEAYSGLDLQDRPMVTTMGMSATKTLAESEFGPVQRGSVLSYQQPKLLSKNIVLHPNAPPSPNLPLEAHKLSTTECVWVCTEEEQVAFAKPDYGDGT